MRNLAMAPGQNGWFMENYKQAQMKSIAKLLTFCINRFYS